MSGEASGTYSTYTFSLVSPHLSPTPILAVTGLACSRPPRDQLLDDPLGVPDSVDPAELLQHAAGARGVHRRGGTSGQVRRLPLLLPAADFQGRATEEAHEEAPAGVVGEEEAGVGVSQVGVHVQLGAAEPRDPVAARSRAEPRGGLDTVIRTVVVRCGEVRALLLCQDQIRGPK